MLDNARWKQVGRKFTNYFVPFILVLPFVLILNLVWDRRIGYNTSGLYFEFFAILDLLPISIFLAFGAALGVGISTELYRHPFMRKDEWKEKLEASGGIGAGKTGEKRKGKERGKPLRGTKPIVVPPPVEGSLSENEKITRGACLTQGPEVKIVKTSIEDQIKAAQALYKYYDAQGVPMQVFRDRFSGDARLAPVHMGGCPLPWSYENTGIFIQGSAGSGKTQVIKQMMWDARMRGGRDKLVVYDRKPEFLDFLWRDNDPIICPADRRHTKWDVFAELEGEQDIDGFIASLMPTPEGGDGNQAFWNSSAKQVMKGILIYLMRDPKNFFRNTRDEYTGKMRASNRELCQLLKNTLPVPTELWSLLKHDFVSRNEASPLKDVDKPQSNVAGSVLATLSSFTASFTLPEVAEPGWLSVKRWITNPATDGQAIFLVNPANYATRYQSYFTVVLDLMLKEMISIPTDITRRVWFFIDEFGSLFKLSSVIRLLAEGRSKGACTVIGVQDRAQLRGQYKDEVGTLLNNCNSKVVGRVVDGEEAKKIADDDVSDFEVVSSGGSLSMSLGKGGNEDGGMNLSEDNTKKRETRKTVMPAQIMQLPGLNYLLKFSSNKWFRWGMHFYNWNEHSICPAFLGKSAEAFESERLLYTDAEREHLGLPVAAPDGGAAAQPQSRFGSGGPRTAAPRGGVPKSSGKGSAY